MSKEIELILYKLEQNFRCDKEVYFTLYKPDIKQLLDYITNLEQEKDKYKNIVKEYERLNKEKGRGFKIINVENYNIDELLKYKVIVEEMEKWLDKKEKLTFNSWNKAIHEVQRKLQELKGGVDNE